MSYATSIYNSIPGLSFCSVYNPYLRSYHMCGRPHRALNLCLLSYRRVSTSHPSMAQLASRSEEGPTLSLYPEACSIRKVLIYKYSSPLVGFAQSGRR